MVTLPARFRRIDVVLPGVALGLYAGRALTEALPAIPHPAIGLSVTAAALIAGLWTASRLHSRNVEPLPLVILRVYALGPRFEPLTSAAVGCVAGLAVALRGALRTEKRRLVPRKWCLLGDALLLLAALALYVRTLAPTILPADGGEYQFVSYVLGIAHPPGYPLYTLVAKLFTLLPWGDVAYRVSLFSAVTSAATLVVASAAVRKATGAAVAGWIAASALGLAPTFWALATTANVRSLTALFVASQVYTLLLYARSRSARHLVAFAVMLGLGLTHHGSLVPLLLPYVGFLLLSDPDLARRPRSWTRPLVAFALSCGMLLYLPLRSLLGAPFDPEPIRGLAGFLEHALALGFRGDMFYFLEPAIVASRIDVLSDVMGLQFGSLWWLLGAWGAAALFVRNRRLLVLFGGILVVNVLLALTYRAPQTVEYVMPAYVALACINAFGIWTLADVLLDRGRGGRTAAAVLLASSLLAPAGFLMQRYASFRDLHQDRSARDYAEQMLSHAPKGARILSNWHFATPMWYLQYVENVRPDVEVAYVYPEGQEPIAHTWRRRVEESVAVGSRPTIVTNLYAEFQSLPHTFRALADGWLVESGPMFGLPQGVQPLRERFDGLIDFEGFELDRTRVSPAESLTVRLYWQPVIELERDYSFFVHLVDERGLPLGQGDVTHSASRYQVRQVILDEYRIPLLPTTRPGRYRLVAGVYITLEEGGWRRLMTATGEDFVLLGEIEVVAQSLVPVTQHPMFWQSTSGYVLMGADYDHSLADQLRLYLHWSAARDVERAYGAVVLSGGETLAAADLPGLRRGEYCTTAHDLPRVARLGVELRGGGDEEVGVGWLGPWQLALRGRIGLPVPQVHERYVSLGGQMVLVRAQFSATAQGGSTLPTVMTLVGSRPLTRDYTVSVKLVDRAGAWGYQHDGTPALGAVPTLKWLRGTTIRDRHDLGLPTGTTGPAVLRLSVYDAFTQQSLPVLDERLARLGQGTEIDLGGIVVGDAN